MGPECLPEGCYSLPCLREQETLACPKINPESDSARERERERKKKREKVREDGGESSVGVHSEVK